jgi:glycosyltransferase involved in cell wall biosynthesis
LSVTPDLRAGVLVIGPMPPPLNGWSLATAAMVQRLRAAAAVEVFDTSPRTLRRGWRYHGRRIARSLAACWTLLWRPRSGGRTLYLPLAGGSGSIYDLMVVCVARARRYRLFLHHHAFSYITQRSHWTALLSAIAGKDATHICLCTLMAEQLRAQYRGIGRWEILSNAALVEPGGDTARIPGPGPIRIGFLSNLVPEKGLDTVIDLCRELRRAGCDVTLSVAGPVEHPSAAALLDEARRDLGPAFDYRGPVHAAAKTAFYRDIDVFLFPTRYANEAQPLVLIEALADGVPVIAIGRGCIAEDLASGGVVTSDGTFLAEATEVIRGWLADRSRLAGASAAAFRRAAELRCSAAIQLKRLVEEITSAT